MEIVVVVRALAGFGADAPKFDDSGWTEKLLKLVRQLAVRADHLSVGRACHYCVPLAH